MASPFITVDPTDTNATHARRLLSLNNQAKTFLESLESFIAESYQMFDGNGEEQFTMPMTKYGVGSKADAQTVFNLCNGTAAALKGESMNANAIDLATRIG
jgi:hypothetical protein